MVSWEKSILSCPFSSPAAAKASAGSGVSAPVPAKASVVLNPAKAFPGVPAVPCPGIIPPGSTLIAVAFCASVGAAISELFVGS